MLNKISRFLFGNKIEINQVLKPKVDLLIEQIKSSDVNSPSAINEFFTSIKDVGHPEYPILDKLYSPNSRVPCTDLIPFITTRLLENDIDSIINIMSCVIEGNPGLGIGSGWSGNSIRKILSVPFEDYVSFKSLNALSELKALFIVASKDGDADNFLITRKIPRLFAWNCIVYQPQWSNNLHSLADKANSWIVEMAKDVPYWQEYKKFDTCNIPTLLIDEEVGKKILLLSPAARLQLFYAVEKGGGSLFSMTNGLTSGPIRSLGININNTSQELLSSGLIIPSSSPKAIESAHSKQELVDYCESFGVSYRKSWKKEQLVEALANKDAEILEEISHTNNVVAPNFQIYPELNNIVQIADEHEMGFKLLCFA